MGSPFLQPVLKSLSYREMAWPHACCCWCREYWSGCCHWMSRSVCVCNSSTNADLLGCKYSNPGKVLHHLLSQSNHVNYFQHPSVWAVCCSPFAGSSADLQSRQPHPKGCCKQNATLSCCSNNQSNICDKHVWRYQQHRVIIAGQLLVSLRLLLMPLACCNPPCSFCLSSTIPWSGPVNADTTVGCGATRVQLTSGTASNSPGRVAAMLSGRSLLHSRLQQQRTAHKNALTPGWQGG